MPTNTPEAWPGASTRGMMRMPTEARMITG